MEEQVELKTEQAVTEVPAATDTTGAEEFMKKASDVASDAAHAVGEAASVAGKAAKKAARKAGAATKKALKKAKGKAVLFADQNGDGKFDKEDVARIAGAVGDATRKNAKRFGAFLKRRADRHDLKTLRPVFEQDLAGVNFALIGLLRVCDRDDRRENSDVCRGAVGYYTEGGNLRVLNIYRDCVSRYGLRLLPDMRQEVYFADPVEPNTYIALGEYFGYLRTARINELQRTAQALGAQHIDIFYTEPEQYGEAPGVNVATIDMSGHKPCEPQLHYLKDDTGVQTLIAMRMEDGELFKYQHNSIKLSNSSGLKEIDARMIDKALRKVKCKGSTSVSTEAARESRAYLEYVIYF